MCLKNNGKESIAAFLPIAKARGFRRRSLVRILKLLIKIVAPLDSVPFKRVAGNIRKYNEQRYRDFKDALGYYALQAMQGRNPFSGAVKLSVDVYKPKPKDITSRNWGDLDNHVKSVMDALNNIAFEDDRQVCEIHARKFFGQPNIIITLEEWNFHERQTKISA